MAQEGIAACAAVSTRCLGRVLSDGWSGQASRGRPVAAATRRVHALPRPGGRRPCRRPTPAPSAPGARRRACRSPRGRRPAITVRRARPTAAPAQDRRTTRFGSSNSAATACKTRTYWVPFRCGGPIPRQDRFSRIRRAFRRHDPPHAHHDRWIRAKPASTVSPLGGLRRGYRSRHGSWVCVPGSVRLCQRRCGLTPPRSTLRPKAADPDRKTPGPRGLQRHPVQECRYPHRRRGCPGSRRTCSGRHPLDSCREVGVGRPPRHRFKNYIVELLASMAERVIAAVELRREVCGRLQRAARGRPRAHDLNASRDDDVLSQRHGAGVLLRLLELVVYRLARHRSSHNPLDHERSLRHLVPIVGVTRTCRSPTRTRLKRPLIAADCSSNRRPHRARCHAASSGDARWYPLGPADARDRPDRSASSY